MREEPAAQELKGVAVAVAADVAPVVEVWLARTEPVHCHSTCP
jgi:hypothetical protein